MYNSIRNTIKKASYKFLDPLVDKLLILGVSPNLVTTLGFIFNFGVAILLIIGAEIGDRNDLSYISWAGAGILFAGVFDMVDGQLARKGKMDSVYGALYDSVLDRYSELVMFLGICYYLVGHHYFLSSIFAFVAMTGSVMVSYVRARAEGLGIECKDGLMQRPERIITIGISALICGFAGMVLGQDFKLYIEGIKHPVFETISFFTLPIAILAVLANWTAVSRLLHCKRALKSVQ